MSTLLKFLWVSDSQKASQTDAFTKVRKGPKMCTYHQCWEMLLVQPYILTVNVPHAVSLLIPFLRNPFHHLLIHFSVWICMGTQFRSKILPYPWISSTICPFIRKWSWISSWTNPILGCAYEHPNRCCRQMGLYSPTVNCSWTGSVRRHFFAYNKGASSLSLILDLYSSKISACKWNHWGVRVIFINYQTDTWTNKNVSTCDLHLQEL